MICPPIKRDECQICTIIQELTANVSILLTAAACFTQWQPEIRQGGSGDHGLPYCDLPDGGSPLEPPGPTNAKNCRNCGQTNVYILHLVCSVPQNPPEDFTRSFPKISQKGARSLATLVQCVPQYLPPARRYGNREETTIDEATCVFLRLFRHFLASHLLPVEAPELHRSVSSTRCQVDVRVVEGDSGLWAEDDGSHVGVVSCGRAGRGSLRAHSV